MKTLEELKQMDVEDMTNEELSELVISILHPGGYTLDNWIVPHCRTKGFCSGISIVLLEEFVDKYKEHIYYGYLNFPNLQRYNYYELKLCLIDPPEHIKVQDKSLGRAILLGLAKALKELEVKGG